MIVVVAVAVAVAVIVLVATLFPNMKHEQGTYNTVLLIMHTQDIVYIYYVEGHQKKALPFLSGGFVYWLCNIVYMELR